MLKMLCKLYNFLNAALTLKKSNLITKTSLKRLDLRKCLWKIFKKLHFPEKICPYFTKYNDVK